MDDDRQTQFIDKRKKMLIRGLLIALLNVVTVAGCQAIPV
jgi:hypothetical protein